MGPITGHELIGGCLGSAVGCRKIRAMNNGYSYVTVAVGPWAKQNLSRNHEVEKKGGVTVEADSQTEVDGWTGGTQSKCADSYSVTDKKVRAEKVGLWVKKYRPKADGRGAHSAWHARHQTQMCIASEVTCC